MVVYVGDQTINRDHRRLQATVKGYSTAATRRARARRVLADVLESAVTSDFNLRDRSRHPGCELAEVKPPVALVVPVHVLEHHEPVRQVEQGVEEVPVMAEAVAPTSGGLWLLTLNQQVQVVGYVLDYVIAGAIHCDVPSVATDRQGEGQKERCDLRVGAHRAVSGDRTRPRQLGHWLGDVRERGPGDETRAAVANFFLKLRHRHAAAKPKRGGPSLGGVPRRLEACPYRRQSSKPVGHSGDHTHQIHESSPDRDQTDGGY